MKTPSATSIFSAGFMQPTRWQALQGQAWNLRGIRVFIKREDERDAKNGGALSGNKWCKLQGYFAHAHAMGLPCVVSVGGAWSNHLHAVAHAGKRFGINTVGIIRGDKIHTPMLQEAEAAGMQLEFVSRTQYRARNQMQWQQFFLEKYSPCLMIPEGGAGDFSHQGLELLAQEINGQIKEFAKNQGENKTVLALPVGSGATFSGLRRYVLPAVPVWGFQAFADATLGLRVQENLSACAAPWALFKTDAMRAHRVLPEQLIHFLKNFEQEENILLDPIYTVRMLARLHTMIINGDVPDNTTVLAVHTGGLQGRRGHSLALAA